MDGYASLSALYRQGWTPGLGWAFVLILVNAYVVYPYLANVPFDVLFAQWRDVVLPIVGGGLGLRLTKAAETLVDRHGARKYSYASDGYTRGVRGDPAG